MRSGRGARLPGMGAPAAPDRPLAAPDTEPSTADAGPRAEVERPPAPTAPPRPKRRPQSSGATKDTRGNQGQANHATAAEAALPAHAPHAGETKVQVNPRIYQGIWRHYEQLVDELPRERRRGALTALVNAILAQHAPRDVDAARTAIAWLRHAELRDTPADTGEQR